AESGHWITYDSNGGSFVASQFVNASDVTVKPADPSRMGYTFAGWKPNDPSFSFGSQLDKNVTLTASWTANSNTKYTVIHWQENANDDNYSFAESEQKSGTTGADTEAIANSYSGFTAEEITQKTIAGDGSTIVNVYYKRNTYTLEFISYTCGKEEHTHSILCLWGVLCDMQEHIHTAECETIVKTITEKWGRNIEGLWPTGAWYVGSNTTVAQVWLETMPQENRTYYGPQTGDGVSKASYYVEPIAGDDIEEHHTDSSAGTGYTVTEEDRYNLTGYTFKEELRVGNETYKSTRIGANYNGAKFYYSRNSYDIVFINNGTTDKTVSKKYEASLEDVEDYTPPRPASIPNKYTFGGWYDNELCEGKAYEFDGTMPAGNITLYAKWTAPEYIAKIHVKVTDDTSEEGFKEYGISYGEKLNPDWLRIPDDIPEGATFVGWGTKSGDTLQLFDTNQQIYTDIELFPIVSDYSKTYSVIYNSNNPADADNAMNIVIDSDKYLERSYAEVKSAKALTAPNGKVFLGWNTTADGTGTMYQPGDKIRISNSNIILYAQWGDKVAAASIIYHSNYPGSTVTPTKHIQNLTNNEKTQILTFEACEACEECDFTAPAGYEFDGWATSSNGEVEYVAGTSVLVDNNLSNELYAKWKCKTFTVTWVDEDGKELEKDEKVPYGTMPSYDGETPTKAA
ncbi:MAG: InlB B-repeat-containing protein, partial [Lentihominibacter sp.]